MKRIVFVVFFLTLSFLVSERLLINNALAASSFTRPLTLGASGTDVAKLQQILKDKGFFTYPTITGYYGNFTKQAVRDFQRANGLATVGSVGPLTRAILNGLGTALFSIPTPLTSSPLAFTRSLYIGSSGSDVSALQRFLQTLGFFKYPTVTGYFGKITKASVSAFQTAFGIEPLGVVGPLTRAKIIELSTPATPIPQTNTPPTPATPIPQTNTPPPSPTSLRVVSERSDQIFLAWDVAFGATSYTVKRKEIGTTEYIVIASNITTNYYTDVSVKSGTMYSYIVTASNAGGESIASSVVGSIALAPGGGGSCPTQTPAPTPSDTTAPTVSMTAPSSGATVSGSSVTFTATASDSSGISSVQFAVDGTNVSSEDTTDPYSIAWDSTTVADGSRSITATAIDTSDNRATSTALSVIVDNTGPSFSSIASSTDATSATVTWTTDESSDSEVVYGLTSSYGTASSSAILTTSHTINLTGLATGTAYHYAVVSTDAQGNTATSSDKTFATDAPLQLTDGLISQWLFSEGSGTTVADTQGVNNIDLTLPTSPGYTWNSRGIATANGLIQTPSITGARTVALLYKTKRNSTSGFLLSGGSSSGAGVLQQAITLTNTHNIGIGNGIHPLSFRTSNGASAYELNRGGYVLIFTEFSQAYNTILGLGGRHSTITSRSDEFEIMGAAVWNDQLNSTERTQVYDYFSYIAKQRGICLKSTDCAAQYSAIILAGESTADGRSAISGLSTTNQNQIFTKPYIWSSNGTTAMSASALFDLGVNQQQTSPSTNFGPELGFAQAIETSGDTVYIIKLGKGSTYLSRIDANGVNQPQPTTSWNTQEATMSGLFWTNLKLFQDAEQGARLNGIGLDLKGVQFLIGLNDALNVNYTSGSAAFYQGYLQDFYDNLKTYTNVTDLKIHIPKAHNHDPSSDATALGYVRQAQQDFVTANGSLAELMDTDSLGLNADTVHYNATSSLEIGQSGYDFLLGSP